jgi:hypothetical protein
MDQEYVGRTYYINDDILAWRPENGIFRVYKSDKILILDQKTFRPISAAPAYVMLTVYSVEQDHRVNILKEDLDRWGVQL